MSRSTNESNDKMYQVPTYLDAKTAINTVQIFLISCEKVEDKEWWKRSWKVNPY